MLKAVKLGRLASSNEGVEASLVIRPWLVRRVRSQRHNIVFDDWDRNVKHMLVGGVSGFSGARQIPATLLMRSVNEHRVCAQKPTLVESRDWVLTSLFEHEETIHARI
jgi:hypothetical protein